MKTATPWLLFCALLAGCNLSDVPDPRSILNNKYDNKTIGLSLQFPSGWVLKTDQLVGTTRVDLLAVSVPVNGITPNVNVIFSAHAGTTDLYVILPQIRNQLVAAFPDFANYSDTVYVAGNGAPVGKIKYTGTSNGLHLKFMQVIIINRSKDIIITYTDGSGNFDLNTDITSIDASMNIY